MAVVRRAASIRAKRDTAPGFRNTLSRILAGPAQGSEVTVRLISVKPGGRLPRRDYDFQRVVTVIQGELIFMDGDGAMHAVSEGDAVIVRAHERHHFQNDSTALARIYIAEPSG
ncbi:MAG: cupin domain-containing protein [Candidatus Aegiribacteria sp.]|nr:cupin domain-containing protein [Candidatus Aegiribacteria sp.]MBD3295011.1 cupin domain-containing protein [Candidatus Fermentibacteria bacterium]